MVMNLKNKLIGKMYKLSQIFPIFLIASGCASNTSKSITTSIPRWVQVVNELGNPLENVVLGVEAPVPLVNQKTNSKGMVKVGRRSLFPNGNVSLHKKGYEWYNNHFDNMPEKVVLRSQ